MPKPDILIGPVLGYEWDSQKQQSFYTIIIRLPRGKAPLWVVDGQRVKMKEITSSLHDSSRVWRGEIALPAFQDPQGRKVSYTVERDGRQLKNVCGDSDWSFFLPGLPTPVKQPRIAFCSCNGFTDPNSLRDRDPLAMWERMEEGHKKEPFSLLLMGGDQLYCDDLARKEGSFARLIKWLKPGEKPKTQPTAKEFIESYFDHYLLAWVRITHDGKDYPHTPMVRMMASIPSIMMWDDHDIFDGWGSYQSSDPNIPYYKDAFDAARLAFEVYQMRGKKACRSLLDSDSDQPGHYSLGLQFGPFHLLVLDNRSHRTVDQVMDKRQWDQVVKWLETSQDPSKSLLLVSPVPVVYRRFAHWVSSLPGEHGGEDDLRDHWSHKTHEWERDRLISHLFSVLKYGDKTNGYQRITLLSGDVHVGAIGFLERTDFPAEIAQIISSAILHPEPGVLQWEGLKAISNDDEHSIRGQAVVAKMSTPVRAVDRYLRCRNFAWLKAGDDGRLWVNWECENVDGKTPERVEFPLR